MPVQKLLSKEYAVTLTPLTRNPTTGALTTGTGLSLAGFATGVREQLARRTVEHTPMDATLADRQPVAEETSVVISGFAARAGSGGSPVQDAFKLGSYLRVAISAGAVTGYTSRTYDLIASRLEIDATGQEAVTYTLTGDTFDNGGPNPAFA